jgi:hypothetical protein
MGYNNIKQVQKMASNLLRTIPSNHKDFVPIHLAPRQLDEAMDAAFELAGWTMLAEYIETQPEDQRNRAKLAEIKGKLKMYQKRVDAADELKQQLAGIAANFQIEQAAKSAGAINPKLVTMIFEDDITHTINSTGEIKVDVGGRSVKSAVESLVIGEDTKFLFDRSLVSDAVNDRGTGNKYSGPNPWRKDSFNLTEQGRIYKGNPALAKRLMKEANG